MKYLINEKALNNMLCVTAQKDDKCVGNLDFYVEDGVLYIRYIYVEEEYRQQGIGSGIIREVGNYVKENRLEGVVVFVKVDIEQRNVLQRFLIKNSFYIPSYDGFIINTDIKNIEKSYLYQIPSMTGNLEEKLYRMNKLPIELKTDFEKNIRYNIEPDCLPENVLGEMIPELSLAVEKDGKISSYVIFSEYEGELYLNSAYVNNKNVLELINLLIYTFEMIEVKYIKYDKLKIRTMNYEGFNLFKKLIKGADINHEVVLVTYRFF